MQLEIDDIKRRGLTPSYADVEKTAIFTCEATMGCVGERDCNAKAQRSQSAEDAALNRWR
jgi:hypothetical protein